MPSGLTHEAETVVPLSPEAAFDAFVDASHFHEWQRAVKRVVDLRGATTEPGSTYVLDHGLGGKTSLTVLAVERPGLYRIRQKGLGSDMTVTVRFMWVAEESSLVRATIELAAGRLTRWLRPPAGLVRKALEDELSQFKKWVDRTHRPGSPKT